MNQHVKRSTRTVHLRGSGQISPYDTGCVQGNAVDWLGIDRVAEPKDRFRCLSAATVFGQMKSPRKGVLFDVLRLVRFT